jgi:hypothetical protein
LFLKFKQIYNKSHINLINTAHSIGVPVSRGFLLALVYSLTTLIAVFEQINVFGSKRLN